MQNKANFKTEVYPPEAGQQNHGKRYTQRVRQLSRILYKSALFMQNKAKVKIGKMNVSIGRIKDYDKNNKQSTTNVIQNKANFQIGRQTTEGRVRPFGPGSREAGSPRNDKNRASSIQNRDSSKAENLQKETVQMFALHLAVGFAILVKQKFSADSSFAPPCLLSQTTKGVTRQI
jgi:hypothetical protein